AERWVHNHGCGRWFNALRDTVSDRVLAIYAMGEQPPSSDDLKIGNVQR
ncbi:MAG: sarcosine oxidase subunit delta, partial [Geminicoccaceae bacterium]|nr:sarcosine oxidase subunit delta [Geminicoccaceae bacterium]